VPGGFADQGICAAARRLGEIAQRGQAQFADAEQRAGAQPRIGIIRQLGQAGDQAGGDQAEVVGGPGDNRRR